MPDELWYCPQCGEPCPQVDGVHPECRAAFGRSVIEDDHDNISQLFEEIDRRRKSTKPLPGARSSTRRI